VDSQEHPVTLADGTVGWHHWVNCAIEDSQGRLVELQGVGRDVTDRRRAEEALARAEARNSAMLRAIPDTSTTTRATRNCCSPRQMRSWARKCATSCRRRSPTS
jgi:PAS domain-containing protein